MPSAPAVLMLTELPADATNREALAWIARMRRLLDRWETLPDYQSRALTPEVKQRVYADLDGVERSVLGNMGRAG